MLTCVLGLVVPRCPLGSLITAHSFGPERRTEVIVFSLCFLETTDALISYPLRVPKGQGAQCSINLCMHLLRKYFKFSLKRPLIAGQTLNLRNPNSSE